jgi:hypothetical protein
MAAEDEFNVCDSCKKGRLINSVEKMKFHQWSKKGYVHCHVAIMVGVCDFCGARALEPGVDRILDEAFQREYDKLP